MYIYNIILYIYNIILYIWEFKQTYHHSLSCFNLPRGPAFFHVQELTGPAWVEAPVIGTQ